MAPYSNLSIKSFSDISYVLPLTCEMYKIIEIIFYKIWMQLQSQNSLELRFQRCRGEEVRTTESENCLTTISFTPSESGKVAFPKLVAPHF